MSEQFFARVGLFGDPLADPAAVVARGDARFTVLTPRLLRLEWSPGAAHDDRPSYAFPTRRAPAPPFKREIAGDGLLIDTGALRLHYAGGRLGPESLEIRLMLAGKEVRWVPGARDPLNLRGARRTLDGCRGEASLEPGLLSRSGWSLFDDSSNVRFDPQGGWVQAAAEGERQDWYFFGYGHDYAGALAEYARFGGGVPMIPRWLLGAWWSRYYAYRERDLRALLAEFQASEVPLDTLVIDMDWHLPPGWTGYTWNRELFPDPPAFLSWLHDQGLRATLNLHPADGVQPFEEAYPAFARAVGADPAGGAGVPFRISDPAFARAYFELLHHPLEEQGVDFWWMDWQQGRESELPGLDPLPWLNHLHFQDMRRRPGRRPLVFSRWGGLGNHRYPIGFSGDTFATWEALRFQPHFTATAANVLYGWWSHDIGGHFGAVPPELYARWVQAGALSPILRMHSTNDPLAERRPWAFPPDAFAAAREAFRTRYALLPYLYSLARVHADRALAPCRPTYYRCPDDEAAYVAREQYMLGDQMLVAPIVHPADPASGLAPADLWVPPGDWVERSTGELLHGPAWARLEGDLAALPQLVRAGGILPMAAPLGPSDRQPADALILSIFPGPAGAARVYADAGEGDGYRSGEYEWTPVTMRAADEGRVVTVTVGPPEGACPGLPVERRDTLRLEFVRRPESLRLDGAPFDGWRYDEGAQALVAELPPRPRGRPAVLDASFAAPASLLGAGRSAALRAADARRLLGPSAEGLADADLLGAALAAEGDARLRAVARLGGPFARVYEHTAPEDAARYLGTLVIAAPRDGSPAQAEGVWRIVGPDGERAEPLSVGDLAEDTIIACPFAWDGSTATMRWSLDLRLRWGGRTLEQRFTAQTLFPTVGAWRTLIRPADQPLAPDDLLDAAGAPRPGLGWRTHRHGPAHGEFQNLTELFNLPFRDESGGWHDVALEGYALATLRSPDARDVRVAYSSASAPQIYLNGQPLAVEEHVPAESFRTNERWSHSAPARLRPGENSLLIISGRPADMILWRWFLSVMVVGPDGLPDPALVAVAP
ncbi:glycoside hydrolase family 31 protein [Oscillochloris sp. ZM17-4]|uniref:glycoside hydrolase family 31 protein n=1 Tax=Oscillochloris sp. ZM17-4 TaxID=2866714 RepID=UPI001C7312E3|nr:glycoside hydrolase family 31 protein [Oscillochloris sp. ZM17-4]MBX0330451.1 glycoside hydrolase family 31 protein [Oscillochloris sp. ZM17-4]